MDEPTVAECQRAKAILEDDIKTLLQAFADAFGVRCYTIAIHDGGLDSSRRIPPIQAVELTVHI